MRVNRCPLCSGHAANRSFDHLVGADEQRSCTTAITAAAAANDVPSVSLPCRVWEIQTSRICGASLEWHCATDLLRRAKSRTYRARQRTRTRQWNAAVETVEAPAYESIRPRCVSSAGIESLICGVQRGPRHYTGLRAGLGQPSSHPASRRRCRARMYLAHILGSETDARAYGVWGRWRPLRPQTSWVGRLLAGELTPKLAAEALQRLGTLGRALRAHWTGRRT